MAMDWMMRKQWMAIFLLLPLVAQAAPELNEATRAAFVAEAVAAHALEASEVEAWLANARYQQSIIDAITRPAEGKPWKAYRPIFMNTARIDGGKAFLRAHWTALSAVEQRTGVPVELVVAIMGVETNYGRITGSYRVLDALYTLGLFYPPREAFFRSELATLFKLAHDEAIDLSTVKGSYAGAMGWGQFMPSSYRAYAVDGDGDGRRDLWNSKPDVFASIANYFVAHGWRADEPVAVLARKEATRTSLSRVHWRRSSASRSWVPRAIAPPKRSVRTFSRRYSIWMARRDASTGSPSITSTSSRATTVRHCIRWRSFNWPSRLRRRDPPPWRKRLRNDLAICLRAVRAVAGGLCGSALKAGFARFARAQ